MNEIKKENGEVKILLKSKFYSMILVLLYFAVQYLFG